MAAPVTGELAVDRATTSMPRRRAVQLAHALGAGLVFAFLVVFVASQWRKLPEYEWRFSAGWLAAAVAATAACYILQAELWRWVLRALGETIPARPARAIWAKSLLVRYVPTNLLLVVTRVVLAARLGVRKQTCLVSIVYELALALAAAVVLGAYSFMTIPLLEDHAIRFAVLAVLVAAIAGLHPRAFTRLADFALRRLGRERLPRALPVSRVLAFAALYAVSWTLMGVGLLAFASSVHPVAGEDVPYVVASYSVAFVVAVLAFLAPGGLGARDAAVAALLAAVLPAAVAAAIAIGFRLLEVFVELAYAGVATALARTRPSLL